MKSRYAAPLALVVWYLLVPPHRICAGCSHYFQPDPPNASLDKWEKVHTYDTATKCKEGLPWYQKKAGGWKLLKRPRVPYISTYSQCIASDDPRPQGKIAVAAEIQLLVCRYSAQCTVRGYLARATILARYADGQARSWRLWRRP